MMRHICDETKDTCENELCMHCDDDGSAYLFANRVQALAFGMASKAGFKDHCDFLIMILDLGWDDDLARMA